MPSLKEQFSTALTQESKEVNWYGIRFNNLPTMGAVLVAAAAFLYDKDSHGRLMLVIILLGLATSLLSLIAMGCNCIVIRMWLKHLRTLVEEDKKLPEGLQQLQDHLLPARGTLPDRLHFFSVDLPAYGIPLAFFLLWAAWLWDYHARPVAPSGSQLAPASRTALDHLTKGVAPDGVRVPAKETKP